MNQPIDLHFHPAAVLIVDAGNGPEEWSGRRWNEYVDRADRNDTLVTAEIVEIRHCPHRVQPSQSNPAQDWACVDCYERGALPVPVGAVEAWR